MAFQYRPAQKWRVYHKPSPKGKIISDLVPKGNNTDL